MKIEIEKIQGKWLINGKEYLDCTTEEKGFFDDFILVVKDAHESTT